MRRYNPFITLISCLIFSMLTGCNNVDQESAQKQVTQKTQHVQRILNSVIKGPVEFKGTLLKDAAGLIEKVCNLPIVLDPQCDEIKVNISLMDPAIQDIFEVMRQQKIINYEVKEIGGREVLYLSPYEKTQTGQTENDPQVQPSENHPALKFQIDGPMKFVNQDIMFLFAMIQSESGLQMVISPDLSKNKISFDLVNPSIFDLLELLRNKELINYEMVDINGDDILFVTNFGKKPQLDFDFPEDPLFQPEKNHPILQKQIQGPIQLVNQDIEYVISILNSEFGVPIKKTFDRKVLVTLNLMNPTLQQILIAACFSNNVAYQVGKTKDGVEVRLYDASKQ